MNFSRGGVWEIQALIDSNIKLFVTVVGVDLPFSTPINPLFPISSDYCSVRLYICIYTY